MLAFFGFAFVLKHSTPDSIPKIIDSIKNQLRTQAGGTILDVQAVFQHDEIVDVKFGWGGLSLRPLEEFLYRQCPDCTLLYAPLKECFCTYNVNIVPYGRKAKKFNHKQLYFFVMAELIVQHVQHRANRSPVSQGGLFYCSSGTSTLLFLAIKQGSTWKPDLTPFLPLSSQPYR